MSKSSDNIEALIDANDWSSARKAINVALRKEPDSHWLLSRLALYALTIVIKHLVLQVCCGKVDESMGHFYMKDFRLLCNQIGAVPVDVRWPPAYAMDDEQIDQFIKRWSDVPPPREDSH